MGFLSCQAKKQKFVEIFRGIASMILPCFAFENKLFEHPIAHAENKNLLIGLDTRLNPLEILYNEVDDHTVNVFHAMKCRKAWRDLANLEEKLWQE